LISVKKLVFSSLSCRQKLSCAIVSIVSSTIIDCIVYLRSLEYLSWFVLINQLYLTY
jgi:hypothetical protein